MDAKKHLEHFRRRAPFYLLVSGLMVLVLLHVRAQPSKVVVTFRLGVAREGLDAMRVRYFRGKELLTSVRFSFAGGRASGPRHTVNLPDGDYDVLVDLDYRGAVPVAVRKRTTRVGPRTWSGRWPLLVRGPGEVTIVIAAER